MEKFLREYTENMITALNEEKFLLRTLCLIATFVLFLTSAMQRQRAGKMIRPAPNIL